MQFVSEQVIEEAVAFLNQSEKNYQTAVETLQFQQPILLSYLWNEDFKVFTPKERDFMLFLLLVIWKSIQPYADELETITEKKLADTEEGNWEKIQSTKTKNFREKLDVFFENYNQEDLLAFLEDTISDEEEEMITKDGRESIFVAMKSILDCLTQA